MAKDWLHVRERYKATHCCKLISKIRNQLVFLKVEVSINSLHDELDRGMVGKEKLAEDGSYPNDK